MDVFVSVGTGLNPKQEKFVEALEARLRAIGLNPQTIGRTAFSPDAPLKAIRNLMERCDGVVVIALERYAFEGGVERPGSDRETPLAATSLPTSWNHIEAAMAYDRELPLLVLADEKIRRDGLLEIGHDWFVQAIRVEVASLASTEFTGILENWRKRVAVRANGEGPAATKIASDPAQMSTGELIKALKPSALMTITGAVATLVLIAFSLGARFFASVPPTSAP